MNPRTATAFQLAIEKAEKLKQNAYIQRLASKDGQHLFKLSWRDGGPLILQTSGNSTQEELDALVLNLRFFIMAKEDTSFPGLAKLACADALSSSWNEGFGSTRNHLNEYLKRSPQLIVKQGDTSPTTNHDVLNWFVYGDLAHADEPQRTYIRALKADSFDWAVMLHYFETVLLHVLTCIFRVAGLCRAELLEVAPRDS